MWDYMPAQVTCKFHKDTIKNERTMPWIMSTMSLFNNQGQIIELQSDQYGLVILRTHLRSLPASLTKIWSTMNMLAWRSFSHYEAMRKKKSGAQGRVTLNSKRTVRSGRNSNSSEILCLSWISASLTKIRSKWLRKGGDTSFSIISQRELLVAMTTTVLIQSAPKPYAAFPPPHWNRDSSSTRQFTDTDFGDTEDSSPTLLKTVHRQFLIRVYIHVDERISLFEYLVIYYQVNDWNQHPKCISLLTLCFRISNIENVILTLLLHEYRMVLFHTEKISISM